jgi:serine/threonine protein kinase/tetratricopeptide (TPR) repeat protein
MAREQSVEPKTGAGTAAGSTQQPSPAVTVAEANGGAGGTAPTIELATGLEFESAVPAARRPGAVRTTIGSYEIIDELGRGGMGVVYRAKQKGLDRIVAIKMLLAGEHAGSDHHARFQTEAQAVARLQHPNIVQIYEVGEHAGLPYFSLEFVPGGSLSRRIGGKPQASEDAAHLVEVIARAVHAAHTVGIVHRDLKPANILLAFGDHSSASTTETLSRQPVIRDGPLRTAIPKIADFGLAKRLELNSQQTRSGAVMGSPSYMAPEQARGEIKEVGPLADVYSIGAILYELLTGRPPFLAASAIDTVHQVVTVEPVPPSRLAPNVPPDLETTCLKCLQKDPRKRYASAEALADDLQRFQRREPILARPVSTPERIARWCYRNPGVAIPSGVAVLLLVGIAVASAWFAFTLLEKNAMIAKETEAALKAKGIAQTEAENAEREKQLAEAASKIATDQSTLAVKTIQKLILEVQARLGEAPQTWEARKAVLKIASEGLSKVADTVDPKATSIGVTEWAVLIQNGFLLVQVGESGTAHELLTKALEIARARVELKQHSDSSRSNLALNLRMVGESSLEVNRDVAKTLEYYREALAIREDILDHPQPGDGVAAVPYTVRLYLVEDLMRVGATIYRLGDPAAALPYIERAMGVAQDLMSTYSTDPDLAQMEPGKRPTISDVEQALIKATGGVGDLSFRLRNSEQSLQMFGQAVERRERMLAENPRKLDLKQECARTYGALGDICLMLGDADRAKQAFDRARAPLEQLVATDPYAAMTQRNLALLYYRLGNYARRINDLELAKENYAKALSIRKDLVERSPENDRRQMELMLAQAHCGEHQPASALANKYASSGSPDNETLIDVARCLAQCSQATDDPALRSEYSSRALGALGTAVAQGYRDVVFLECDPDLDPLRDQAAFNALLVGIGNGVGQ